MKLQVSLNMMPACSLLIAFLFCIDHVARLEAIGVHNWSTIFNNNPSKNWVFLVAGSNTWVNYRHQDSFSKPEAHWLSDDPSFPGLFVMDEIIGPFLHHLVDMCPLILTTYFLMQAKYREP
ncbi:hypothetical protein T265_14947 [Opisthorchis viverrini]|uniref:Uncharacterized protein n=1 Tax=Opisthorchis viverrini TaxID=6198 RepID=A0A075A3V7_OPIVI|nr:hypothetical protein T265_14947 [Opisthorchis viverrini]KER22074.1 hypothetical protein T265_14947 [Opisthorchis viverrini]